MTQNITCNNPIINNYGNIIINSCSNPIFNNYGNIIIKCCGNIDNKSNGNIERVRNGILFTSENEKIEYLKEKYGIITVDIKLFRRIPYDNDKSLSKLENITDIGRNTISTRAKILEARGFVEIVCKNGNSKIIKLTEKGKKLKKEIVECL